MENVVVARMVAAVTLLAAAAVLGGDHQVDAALGEPVGVVEVVAPSRAVEQAQ